MFNENFYDYLIFNPNLIGNELLNVLKYISFVIIKIESSQKISNAKILPVYLQIKE